jgi:hypothetical protein
MFALRNKVNGAGASKGVDRVLPNRSSRQLAAFSAGARESDGGHGEKSVAFNLGKQGSSLT